MMSVAFTYAQDKKQTKLEKKGDTTEVTYYHENGNVQQIGCFDAQGKLHGEWISFDINGEKVAIGNYENGKKVGKWFFWNNNSLNEVDYIDSKIVNVSQWNNKSTLAIRNK